MINKIVHEMALNGDSYKISAVVENFILNKVKEYFTDCSVSYQEKMVLTDDTEKSNNLFCRYLKSPPQYITAPQSKT